MKSAYKQYKQAESAFEGLLGLLSNDSGGHFQENLESANLLNGS